MAVVIREGKLSSVTNTALGLSPKLKSYVRRRMLFPFNEEDVPKEVSKDLLRKLDIEVEHIIKIRKRNLKLCPSIIIESYRNLTKANSLPPTEWIKHYNSGLRLPTVYEVRRASARMALEYRRMARQTDPITTYWCLGHGMEAALEVHRKREALVASGEGLMVSIFGSLSGEARDLEVLRLLSTMLRLDPKLELEAITDLIQRFTLAVE